MALALTRLPEESVIIHAPGVGLIKVKIRAVDPGQRVRLLIDAPEKVRIMREELLFRTPRPGDSMHKDFLAEVEE